MDDKTILLVHLDFKDGTHEYVPYEIPVDREDDARTAVEAAWDAYGASGRQGLAEDAFAAALRCAGIPFVQKSCEPVLIRA